MPPCFFAGDLNGARYGLLGLNPGLAEGREKELDLYKDMRESNKLVWEEFYPNFFTIFKENEIHSQYYKKFGVLLSGILNYAQIPKPLDRYELLQENLVNFDLIPYHSKNFKIGMINEDQFHIIKPYVDITKELIQKSSVEYLFISGKPWEPFVSNENNLLDAKINYTLPFFEGEKTQFTAHFGKCMGKDFVWFDKFVTSIRGLTNEDLHYIGKQIAKKWGIA